MEEQKQEQLIIILRCISSFYIKNQNGSLDRKIPCGSIWLDLGIENHLRKLKRVDRRMKQPYAYIDKNTIVRNFELKGEYTND